MPATGLVLCVRVRPLSIPPQVKADIQAAFPDRDLQFIFVNPMTPEELAGQVAESAAVAVYLQERPLPATVLEEGQVPCLVPTPDGVKRLKGIQPILEPLGP
jgi:tryptophan synthase alpha subunit